jgi:hypothetical protein
MKSDVLRGTGLEAMANVAEPEAASKFRGRDEWSPEQFEREQLRGLMRQVFFSNAAQPVRQVLFTAADVSTEIALLCRQVGEALAREIKGNVAVLGRVMASQETTRQEERQTDFVRSRAAEDGTSPQNAARRIKGNLWLLSELPGSRSLAAEGTILYSRLCELRTEFDYSIVEGPPAAVSSEAAALGQLTDGVVLVLTAYRTRRAAAQKIKEMLERSRIRILGTVLAGRTFPIPSALYRRL